MSKSSDIEIKFSGASKFHALNRLHIVEAIIKNIKENPNIKSDQLVSNMFINEPFLSEDMTLKFLKHLLNANKIKIDDNDVVTLC